MININVPFDFKESVWYVFLSWHTYKVAEGNVFGVTVFNRCDKLDTRIIFKECSVPVEFVFKTQEEAEAGRKAFQEKHDKEFNIEKGDS
jgi:hypothetical protein